MLRWRCNLTRSSDLRPLCYAQPRKSTHPHVPIARILHGIGERDHRAYRNAIAAACLNGTCPLHQSQTFPLRSSYLSFSFVFISTAFSLSRSRRIIQTFVLLGNLLTSTGTIDPVYYRRCCRSRTCKWRLAVYQPAACGVDLLWMVHHGSSVGNNLWEFNGVNFECTEMVKVREFV